MAMSISARLASAALALSLLSFAPPAIAQEADDEGVVFGDWQLRCEILADESEQCALTQYVVAEDREGTWLRAYVFRPADGDATLLSVLVPLRIILTEGLGVRVDGGEPRNFEFVTCTPDGCLASVELDDSLRNTLSGGDEALFVFFFENDAGVGVPVSLRGFTAGLEALP